MAIVIGVLFIRNNVMIDIIKGVSLLSAQNNDAILELSAFAEVYTSGDLMSEATFELLMTVRENNMQLHI